MPFLHHSDENDSHCVRTDQPMNKTLARITAFPVVTAPFKGLFWPLSRHLDRRTPEQIFQPPHVVDQVHQADLDLSPYLAFGTYPEPTAGHHMGISKNPLIR